MTKLSKSPHQSSNKLGKLFLLLAISVLAIVMQSNGFSQALNETFNTPPDYSNNWTLVSSNGPGQQISYTSGSFQLVAPRPPSYPPVSGFLFSSNLVFSGDVDMTFEFNHQGYGRTWVGIISEDNTTLPLSANLDTDDTNYLNFGVGNNGTEYKYAGTPYMNGWTTVRIQIVGLQVNFYAGANGAAPVLLETFPLSASLGKFRVMFSVTSVPWKSGANVTTFRKITAVTPSSTGTNNCQAQIDAANAKIQDLTQQLATLTAQNSQLNAQASTLSAQNTQYQNQLALAAAENAALTASVADLQTHLATANATIQTLAAANASLQTDASSFAALMQKLTQVFRVNFNNPQYQIPGSSSLQQLQSVVSAITGINNGQQQAIYTQIGGSPGK